MLIDCCRMEEAWGWTVSIYLRKEASEHSKVSNSPSSNGRFPKSVTPVMKLRYILFTTKSNRRASTNDQLTCSDMNQKIQWRWWVICKPESDNHSSRLIQLKVHLRLWSRPHLAASDMRSASRSLAVRLRQATKGSTGEGSRSESLGERRILWCRYNEWHILFESNISNTVNSAWDSWSSPSDAEYPGFEKWSIWLKPGRCCRPYYCPGTHSKVRQKKLLWRWPAGASFADIQGGDWER